MNEINANTTLPEPAMPQEQQAATASQEEQTPAAAATAKKKKAEEQVSAAASKEKQQHAQGGVHIDERRSLLSNIYSNFKNNYNREPWIKQENFEKILPALEKIGQTLEKLSEAGALDNLIDGKVTSKVLPIIVIIDGRNIETTGKLTVHQNAQGDTQLKTYPVKKEPNLKEYFGHAFTEEEAQNINKTGTPGKVIMAEFKKEEGKVPVLLKLDKDTNHFFVTRQNFVKIPDAFFNATLSDEQKEQLKNGQVVKVENMTSKKTGKSFYANVQYSAEKKGLELLFEESQKQNFPPKKIANKELSQEQQSDLASGKTIYIADLKDKQGKSYNAYIRKDPETGKLKFFSKNPEDPTVQKIPASEHKTQVAANNDGHKPKALENLKGPAEQEQPNTPTAKQETKQLEEVKKEKTPAEQKQPNTPTAKQTAKKPRKVEKEKVPAEQKQPKKQPIKGRKM
jgi:hypothetical protein